MRDFRKYNVWGDSHQFVLNVYQLLDNFPKEELFGITSQLKRASTSIPTNFSEGCGAFTDKEFARYISIAIASCSEVEYLLILSKDLKYLTEEQYHFLHPQLIQIRKQLYNLRQTITQS